MAERNELELNTKPLSKRTEIHQQTVEHAEHQIQSHPENKICRQTNCTRLADDSLQRNHNKEVNVNFQRNHVYAKQRTMNQNSWYSRVLIIRQS